MKIGIDMQTTVGQKTGFGFYVENLVNNLERIDRINEYKKLIPISRADYRSLERWWWDQVRIPQLARRFKIDLLHQPAFSAPILFPGPIVVTLHDLIAIHYGADIPLGSRLYFGKWMPFSYRYADHIIAISEHTKRDAIKLLGLDEAKITVIYEAADSVFQPIRDRESLTSIRAKYQTGDKFILHVGTLNPRKNLEFLVKVFAEVRKRVGHRWKLVITGQKGWYYEGLFKLVEKLGLQSAVVFTGYINDHDKPLLYNAASIFAFPSLYEGAGLPPLEAMSCGTPVVSSNTSSLPEMVGEGGILLSPTNLSAWARALTSLIADASLRRELAGKGRKQARRFSWERTAKETIRIYEATYARSRRASVR
ncbi:glycosyltransferase family 4 protein [Candidatus Berkelbacteria bacterium]|nr:glycosyltransferase family 4 protein [Candidatus Berkelbacteria bacterium]